MLTYDLIMLNNGWADMIDYSYDVWLKTNEDERQKGIDLGRKVYAEHYYDIIDTVNFTKNTKEFFESLINEPRNSYLLFSINQIYKQGKKIMVLHDYKNVRDFIVR